MSDKQNDPAKRDIFEVFKEMKQKNADLPRLIEEGGKFGLIDKDGNRIIPPVLQKAYSFFDGLCRAQNENGKWGWFDRNGTWVIPAQFDSAEAFGGDGLAKVTIDGKRGEINMKGQWVIGPFDIDEDDE